jgi:hypothetical protein
VTDGEWDFGVPRFGFSEIESLADLLVLEVRQQALSTTVANDSLAAKWVLGGATGDETENSNLICEYDGGER